MVIGYFLSNRKNLTGNIQLDFFFLLLEKRGIHIVLRKNKFFEVFYQCCLVYFKPRGLFYSKGNFVLAFCFLVWNMWYPIFGKSGKIIFKVECIQNECFFLWWISFAREGMQPCFFPVFYSKGYCKTI